jgi:MinD-like ATPase involved in chromosome partitioning or flagellar assembly
VVVCCWSSKGGAGTTVVASALAVLLARRSPDGAVLVDLAGDVPTVLGLPDDAPAGVSDWLAIGERVPADGLARLERPAGGGVAIVPRGGGPLPDGRARALAALLATDHRPVVIDAGVIDGAGVAATIASSVDTSLLVTRPCFLSLRRALGAPLRPSGIVLVVEEGRALVAADVEGALGVPVCAQVLVTPQVARAVDAGVLPSRLPRSLERELRDVA